MNSQSGMIAIVGRPNVGKSTLMNRILGEKLSITSRKPQTTRHRILGIKTIGSAQFVYVDTPGIHSNSESAMNRYLNRAATSGLEDVDIVIFVVDGEKWSSEDELVVEHLRNLEAPVVAVIIRLIELPKKISFFPLLRSYLHEWSLTQ